MVYPNADCLSFANWLLTPGNFRFSGPRLAIIQTVQIAANSATSVTDNVWYNFNRITWQWYNQYLQSVNLAGSLQPDLLTWLSYLTVQPSTAFINQINTFMSSLIAYGIWSELDRLWLFATEQQQHTTISLKNPASSPLTYPVAPTWLTMFGYTGNGYTQYLNTNFTLSTDAVKWQANSASMGVYSRTNSTANTMDMGSLQGSSYNGLSSKWGDGKAYPRINGNCSSAFSVTTSKGFNVGVKSSATVQSFYQDGALIGNTYPSASAINSIKEYVLGMNNSGSLVYPSARQTSLAFYGSGSINQTNFNTAVQTLATAQGWNN